MDGRIRGISRSARWLSRRTVDRGTLPRLRGAVSCVRTSCRRAFGQCELLSTSTTIARGPGRIICLRAGLRSRRTNRFLICDLIDEIIHRAIYSSLDKGSGWAWMQSSRVYVSISGLVWIVSGLILLAAKVGFFPSSASIYWGYLGGFMILFGIIRLLWGVIRGPRNPKRRFWSGFV